MPRKSRPPLERRQISVRVHPDNIERLEERAMEESIRLGVNVNLTNLINRGIDLVLATPLPGKPARVSKCNLAPGVGNSTICVECKQKSPTRTIYCADLKAEVTRGS